MLVLKLTTLKFTIKHSLYRKPLALQDRIFACETFERPGEIVYDLQEVQILTLQSPEFEAVNFRTNITSHSSPGTLLTIKLIKLGKDSFLNPIPTGQALILASCDQVW